MMTAMQHGLSTTVAAACVLALAGYAALVHNNRSLRAEVDTRQQYLQQSVQLEGLYNDMVRALAELSARNNDTQLRTLLQKNGITYNVNADNKKAAP
jgi:ABC-type transport system involved in cytochrome bd biosynthesis fused ATPase/permease subunit